jgi:hypothetical protein
MKDLDKPTVDPDRLQLFCPSVIRGPWSIAKMYGFFYFLQKKITILNNAEKNVTSLHLLQIISISILFLLN